MLPLNHLDTLFSSSSINHDFLEDDGWVVRSEGEGVDAIGSSRQFQLYHLINDASGYRWIIDIVQEVLLAAFKKLKEGQQVEELDRYIIRSVSNACRDYLRKNRPQIIAINEAASMPNSNGDKQIHEEFLRISKLLEDIPQEQAEIVRMKCYDNLTFREIAELEEIPEATVKSRYRYAIQHIQQRLRKEKSI